ncbi:MAG: polysaccharide biosynthesis/export family protein [Caulobacteraceae bacterium]
MHRREARSPSNAGRRAWPLVAAVVLIALAPMAWGAGHEPADTQLAALSAPQGDYVIGPQDKLRIRVFEVKDLSSDVEQVDADGQIELPLIGKITAAGKTADQLEDVIAQRLGERYLQNPQVSVAVVESASQKVTVEGEVKASGVFQMKGRTTLMQAIAMAGGVGPNADMHKVAVIRTVGGVRKAAICDYAAIRDGKAPDPEIEGDDVVVVDGSTAKTAWNQFIKTLPMFAFLSVLH